MAANFFWYELMTTDVAAAESFYKAVVGWTSEPFVGAEMTYTIMKAGDTGVVGLMGIPAEAKAAGATPSWLGYIHADDVDAGTKDAKSAGGAVHREPQDIPGVGRFSVVADPQGAMYMLMQPIGEDQPPAPPMTAGHIGWHELYAANWESAFNFYAGQYGWTKGDALDMGPVGKYQMFTAGADPVGAMLTKPEQVPDPNWLFYFNVPDIDAAAKRVEDNGGTILVQPMRVPGGAWIIQAVDPQGALFALAGWKG